MNPRFKQGQRVVCIDSNFSLLNNKSSGLIEGKSYYIDNPNVSIKAPDGYSVTGNGVTVLGHNAIFLEDRFLSYDEDISLELEINDALYMRKF